MKGVFERKSERTCVMRMTERRIASRVQAALPTSFVVRTDCGGEFRWLVGSTTNASKSGILMNVRGSVKVPSGSEGLIRISVYRNATFDRPLRYLTARAVVRRIYSARDNVGLTRMALEYREQLTLLTATDNMPELESTLHDLGLA